MSCFYSLLLCYVENPFQSDWIELFFPEETEAERFNQGFLPRLA